MQIFDGQNTIELKRQKDCVQVQLSKIQYDADMITVIQNHVETEENENGLLLTYSLPDGAVNFRDQAMACETRLEKLQLADKISQLARLENRYRIACIHPENLFLSGEELIVVHFGLRKMLTPMEYDPELFLKNLKALVVSIMKPKLSYEKLIEGSKAVNDAFTQALVEADTSAQLVQAVRAELAEEKDKEGRTRKLVSKNRYYFYRFIGIFGLLAAVISCVFLFRFSSEGKKQQAIIEAQENFITNNYAGTQSSLAEYSPNLLPKSAKYVLAVSSVNLTDLTVLQKENICNKLSVKSDDNTLDYWIYMGRGDFDKALNLAQNLGDEQLILLAYTDLYQATQLDTKMDGAEKQKLLEEYKKQIDELIKQIEEVE